MTLIYRLSHQYYTVAVGKLNICKLANLLEIDVYVLVACPENTLIDSRVSELQGRVLKSEECG